MLLDVILGNLGGGELKRLSRQLNADDAQTQSAVQSAVPLLLGALTKNASSPKGADSLLSALERDHDGSLLDDVGSFLGAGSTGSGEGILKHLLGARRQSVEQAVSQTSGLDLASVSKLLGMLAPIVMGALGRTRAEQGFDAGGLLSLLQGEMRRAGTGSTGVNSLLSLLDSDGDGEVVDDIAKLGGGMLGKLFG